MSDLLRPVTALLVSAAIVLMGNGLQGILLPIRAEVQGFTAFDIGLVGAAYYAGLLAGCFACPRIVARVGHVRAFTAFTAVATIAPLMHAIVVVPFPWWVLRFVTGLCFAGLYMVIESWLNAASTNDSRGSVLSVYTVINLTVMAGGQMLIGLGDPLGFELFSLTAILISLAAVPVALGSAVAPGPPQAARLELRMLARVSPVAIAGCLATGLANGAFWSLGAVYAARQGLDPLAVAVFVSAAVVGGALLQWPLGYASDRIDRRRIILLPALAAAAAGTMLALADQPSMPVLCALAFLYGASAVPIYAISNAHANDFVAADRTIDVSSGLLFCYSGGAVIGPMIASALMGAGGDSLLFAFTAAIHAALAAFAALRLRQGRAAPAATRDEFVAVPSTSPAAFALDPRAAPEPRTAQETAAGDMHAN